LRTLQARPDAEFGLRQTNLFGMSDLGRRFQRLWLATVVSSLGDGMLVSGFQLLAERRTTNEFHIAAIYAIGRIPWAAALLFGTWVDGRNARTVLVTMDIGRAFVLGCLGVMLLMDPGRVSLEVLILAALLLNIASVCFFCGAQRALPSVVSDANLEKANGRQEIAMTAGEQLVGPPLGGLLFLGGRGPVLGDAASFATSAFLLASLPSMPPVKASGTPRSEIKMGSDFFRSSPVLRSLTAVVSALAFFQAYTLSTLVVMGKLTFGLSDLSFGIFLAAIATGNILGGFAAPTMVRRLGPATIPTVMVVAGLCYLACSRSRSPVLVACALGIEGVGIIAANVFNGAARTRLTPPHLRGRVVGLSRAFIYGAQVPGALTAGVIARQLGTDWVFAIAGTAFVVLGLAIARPLQKILRENPGWQAASQPTPT
jgi:hypothetical protein